MARDTLYKYSTNKTQRWKKLGKNGGIAYDPSRDKREREGIYIYKFKIYLNNYIPVKNIIRMDAKKVDKKGATVMKKLE